MNLSGRFAARRLSRALGSAKFDVGPLHGVVTLAEGCARCEAFSDGVFAIASTLLVLEIRLPHAGVEGSLWTALAALWPSYLAFALSFFVILVTWIGHHDLMRLVRVTSRPFLLANGFVLLYVTFIPFPTAVLASQLAGPESSAAVTLYCGTFAVGAVVWNLMLRTIERGQLFRPEVDAQFIKRLHRVNRWILLMGVATTLLALFLPPVALAVTFAVRLLLLRIRYDAACSGP